MGNFSRNTFDKLKHYVGVRLQQGVPLVDADWNENDDIRKWELQAFLKWYIGNGVPTGNNGFRILATDPVSNDFVITGGDGTPEGAGRCLVEGWDVINDWEVTHEDDLKYTTQPLYENAALASEWGVDPLPQLNLPTNDRTDTVYLDVWEREVDYNEDENLVNPDIGIPTCVRLKREWVVRVAEGKNPDELDPPPGGHVFYPLALLNRRNEGGTNSIKDEEIIDIRLTQLSIISLKDIQQIIADSYGFSYILDHDGHPNLKISLREAINDILRGGLPSTTEQSLPSDAPCNFWGIPLEDHIGDIWCFWLSWRGSKFEIWYNKHNHITCDWEDEKKLSDAPSRLESLPSILEDSNGDIWVFWSSYNENGYFIWSNRFICTINEWEGDRQLTNNPKDDFPFAFEDSSGNIWLFWASERDGEIQNIWYNRFNRALDDWEGETQWNSNAENVSDTKPFAIEDKIGNIWVFWKRYSEDDKTYNIYYNRCKKINNVYDWEGEQNLTLDDGKNDDPYSFVDINGNIYLFWTSDRNGVRDIWLKRFIFNNEKNWEEEDDINLTNDINIDCQGPYALELSDGDIYLFWNSETDDGKRYICYRRYNYIVGAGGATQLTNLPKSNGIPLALKDHYGDIWIFWTNILESWEDATIRYRKMIPIL